MLSHPAPKKPKKNYCTGCWLRESQERRAPGEDQTSPRLEPSKESSPPAGLHAKIANTTETQLKAKRLEAEIGILEGALNKVECNRVLNMI